MRALCTESHPLVALQKYAVFSNGGLRGTCVKGGSQLKRQGTGYVFDFANGQSRRALMEPIPRNDLRPTLEFLVLRPERDRKKSLVIVCSI